MFQNSKVKERKTNMKVRFAHNGAVIGTLGTTGTITAEDAGAKIDPSTEQLVGNQFFGKYGNWIKFGLDALDVGTDFLAQNAWEKQAKEKGLAKDVEFYLQFFKYGMPPHGGFAIGVDRLTLLLLGLDHIRDAQFIFRGPNRLEP